MVVLVKRKGETKDALFRKFSRSFIEEDVVNEIRKRQFYKKPSIKRKEELKERLKDRSRNRKRFSFKKPGFRKYS